MKIQRYSIPKLPRNKYRTATIAFSNGGSGGDSIVNNYVNNTEVVDNLLSTDKTAALSANQGKILNETKPSKVKDEVIDGRYEFTNGLLTGNITTEGQIKTLDYSDIDDKGAALYQNEAKTEWNGILDNLTVRGKFNVTNLEVEEARHIGGDIYLTKAGFKCTKVEVMQEGATMVRYKCYFNNVDKDGLKINNLFEAGDMAFCQQFNTNKVRKWWRAVHGTGENYIIVDGTQCLEGSSIPQEGDHIVQLGNLARTPDAKERQTAVILWSDSICLYRGINDFVLPEPYIRLDPRNTKIDAETINFLGKTIINGNFIVDKSGNLTVQGKIIATSGEFTGTIKANEGNIGNFIIKDGGLYNDTNTKANITISDGQMDVQGHLVGTSFVVAPNKNSSDAICQVGTNAKFGKGLYSYSQTGTALEAYSPEGYGIKANRAFFRGLSIMPYVVTPQDLFAQGRLDLSYDYDMYTFMDLPFEKSNIFFPAIEYTVGKIYIIKNIGNKVHTINTLFGTGDMILDTYIHGGEVGVVASLKLYNNRTYMFINDGTYWSLIYEHS